MPVPQLAMTASQEERSIFWEVIVSVILSKKVCMYVAYSEWFPVSIPELLIRKRYYILFLILVFIVQVTKLVQSPDIIHFRKFHQQHQCTLQLVREHGMLFV
jgi:hypothetical protein